VEVGPAPDHELDPRQDELAHDQRNQQGDSQHRLELAQGTSHHFLLASQGTAGRLARGAGVVGEHIGRLGLKFKFWELDVLRQCGSN